MASITDQVRWRRVLNHVAADLKMLASIAAGEKITVEQAVHASLKLDAYKPSPAKADLDAIEVTVQGNITLSAIASLCVIGSWWPNNGKIWVITIITAYNSEGTCARVQIVKKTGANAYLIKYNPATVRYESISPVGIVILDSEESLEATFVGCSGATDKCTLAYHGFQVSKY